MFDTSRWKEIRWKYPRKVVEVKKASAFIKHLKNKKVERDKSYLYTWHALWIGCTQWAVYQIIVLLYILCSHYHFRSLHPIHQPNYIMPHHKVVWRGFISLEVSVQAVNFGTRGYSWEELELKRGEIWLATVGNCIILWRVSDTQ